MIQQYKMTILSISYKVGDKRFIAKPVKAAGKKTNLLAAEANERDCNCGEKSRCVNGKRRICMRLPDGETCIWFDTNQPC